MTSSPYINHFIQPDSIIPNPSDPQSFNRYSYVQNNPIRYSDPTGHYQQSNDSGGCYNDDCPTMEEIDAAFKIGQDKKKFKEKYGCAFITLLGHCVTAGGENIPITEENEISIVSTQYEWDVAADLEFCNGNWACIESTMRLYYEDLGYPIDQLVATPLKQNPLGVSELYFVEPPILMEMMKSENIRFLKILIIDPAYPFNYEPVYLQALQRKYPRQHEFAKDRSNWVAESIPDVFEFYFDLGGYKWVIGER